MMTMTTQLGWTDMALRLALTVLAGLLLGYNRSEHGKAAGMRTTLLVCLAASIAMLQVNLLLPMSGRQSDSFVMNDLMRLPLGILTGVGFIGGGAILRRDDMVVGVTTAATLWLATVIGLCLGGGQLELGAVATSLGVLTLWVLKWLEDGLRRERTARIAVEIDTEGPAEPELHRLLRDGGLAIWQSHSMVDIINGRHKFVFKVGEFRRRSDNMTPGVLNDLERRQGVVRVEWRGGD
jgi:putative Mg2+ transporter-C (MgtC) family protein